MLTAERLRELLAYDPLTGVFTRRMATGRHGRNRAGTVAGSMSVGHVHIRIDGELFQAHRLAWLYVHGEWPPDQIDHINGVRHANMISNLRLATQSENQQNRHNLRTDNTSGMTGVSWFKRNGMWRAEITINGTHKHLGYFDSKEVAIEARRVAEELHHPFRCPRNAPKTRA